MSVAKKEIKRITTHVLQAMKEQGERISMLTAYDYSMARILDDAGIDILLVGDSASNVMAGHETTLPITLEQMIYHAQSVIRAVERAFVVVDLPFGSYQGNSTKALNSAISIMKESGAHAVKLEGGAEIEDSVRRILSAGVPVMGHLGLTPQSIYKFGTYSVRAKEEAEAQKLKDDAKLLQEIGLNHGDKTISQVALNWLICKGALPIPGAKSLKQAENNAGGAGWRMTDEEVARLDEATDDIREYSKAA